MTSHYDLDTMIDDHTALFSEAIKMRELLHAVVSASVHHGQGSSQLQGAIYDVSQYIINLP